MILFRTCDCPVPEDLEVDQFKKKPDLLTIDANVKPRYILEGLAEAVVVK